MPLDRFYTLPPEKQEELADKAAARFAELHARTPEQRKATAERTMAFIDSLPPRWRALVHEYGWKAIARALNNRESYESVCRRLTLTRVEFTL